MQATQIRTPLDLESMGRDLLNRVEVRARQDNYATGAIQAIAREELECLDCGLVFEPELWANFIQSTTVPQGQHWFSNMPLVLARNRNLYVELLCWMSATTDIHAHAFCGAFRVMQGSSVHTRYRFQPERWVSDAMALGPLQCLGSEYLHQGSVREIVPGRNGLVHALFHLEAPSLTLLVRTHSNVAAKPQLAFFPPGLAIDSPGLEKDEELKYLSRLLALSAKGDPVAAEKTMFKVLSRLDAPRLFHLSLTFSSRFASDESRQRLIDLVARQHGEELAQCLDQVLSLRRVELEIKAARETVDDAELRFFLALLLNVKDRETLLSLVQARFPEREPIEACAEWLLGLAKSRANAAGFMRELAARAAEGAGHRLGSRIAQRIPAEKPLESVQAWLQEENGSKGVSVNPLLHLPELEPLFRDSAKPSPTPRPPDLQQ